MQRVGAWTRLEDAVAIIRIQLDDPIGQARLTAVLDAVAVQIVPFEAGNLAADYRIRVDRAVVSATNICCPRWNGEDRRASSVVSADPRPQGSPRKARCTVTHRRDRPWLGKIQPPIDLGVDCGGGKNHTDHLL